MIKPANIRTGIPSVGAVVSGAILVFIAGAIVGAGIVVLIWSPA